MSLTTIQVVRDDVNESVVDVHALPVAPGLAITPSLNPEWPGWALTHIPTGRCVSDNVAHDPEALMHAAHTAGVLDLDWSGGREDVTTWRHQSAAQLLWNHIEVHRIQVEVAGRG